MSKNKINHLATYSLLGIILIVVLSSIGFLYQYNKDKVANLASAEEVLGKQVASVSSEKESVNSNPWDDIYPNTKVMTIASHEVQASVAENWPDRIKGLSGTPYLPENVVKLFVFDSSGFHAIWMKDMNYAIDILWVDAESKIIHIEEKATPDSYPKMFVPETPAKYVIETPVGFVENKGIKVGDLVVLPLL